jgi:hypothetical protein
MTDKYILQSHAPVDGIPVLTTKELDAMSVLDRLAYFSRLDDHNKLLELKANNKELMRKTEVANKTLRDEFAIAAMQGNWACESFETYACDEALEEAANLYYRMADAMMKARNR